MIEYDDIKFKIDGLNFTWDDEKAEINKRKHDIDFFTASSVFFDKDAFYEFNSLDENTGEERFSVTGLIASLVFFVVYVERVSIDGKDVFRIISARRATKKERLKYVNGIE